MDSRRLSCRRTPADSWSKYVVTTLPITGDVRRDLALYAGWRHRLHRCLSGVGRVRLAHRRATSRYRWASLIRKQLRTMPMVRGTPIDSRLRSHHVSAGSSNISATSVPENTFRRSLTIFSVSFSRSLIAPVNDPLRSTTYRSLAKPQTSRAEG